MLYGTLKDAAYLLWFVQYGDMPEVLQPIQWPPWQHLKKEPAPASHPSIISLTITKETTSILKQFTHYLWYN